MAINTKVNKSILQCIAVGSTSLEKARLSRSKVCSLKPKSKVFERGGRKVGVQFH